MAMKADSPERITITRPDDWHLHLRDGEAMADVLRHSAARFGRALIMPNLKPPVTTVEMIQAYRRRIIEALPYRSRFGMLMTLYLTDDTTPEEIAQAKKSGLVHAAKLYPANATTNSAAGVTDFGKMVPVFEAMEECGLVLSIHGERLRLDGEEVDVFDREKVFLEYDLGGITIRFPKLRIVLEHITTAEAVALVRCYGDSVAATITAHHLLENRNAIFRNGLNPHHWCLPVLKRERDRQALLRAATSGNPKFFLGTDSAPHAKGAKENACGCAGCFTAHAAIELYAEAFDSFGKLDRLEEFASFHGADFYGLPRNRDTITLIRQERKIPDLYPLGSDSVVPYRAGQSVAWTLEDQNDH